MIRRSIFFLVCCGLLASSCGRPPRRAQEGDSYLILAAELERSDQRNVYDAVRHLRPFWLGRTVRGRTGENTISIYLDERLMGTLSTLQHIPVSGTKRVQYMRSTEAQSRFGQSNGGRAAILVQTLKSDPEEMPRTRQIGKRES